MLIYVLSIIFEYLRYSVTYTYIFKSKEIPIQPLKQPKNKQSHSYKNYIPTKMRALLDMAKQRRKDDEGSFKPLSKLNLNNRKQPQPQPEQQQEQYMNEGFEQEQYQYDENQILGYAEYIGIKLPQEEDLLYLAQEGLMASLPADWEEQQTEDGEIVYVNKKTGEAIQEHPCDQYYRQLVIKQRKKRGGSKAANKFTGIKPVGGHSQLPNQQSKLSGIQPKKDIDPLVKMQQQKKKKKMQEQKRKEFEQKKKQIRQKYDKKKQQLQKQHKTKQNKLKSKYEQQLQSQRKKYNKKMSEQQKNQQQKIKKQMQKFQKQTRAKYQKIYLNKRNSQKDKLQKQMKSKRQEIRLSLQNILKSKKKQLEDEYKQKIKILSDRQKSNISQKSQSDLLAQQLEQLKQQIIQKRIKQYEQKITEQKQIQEVQFKNKLNQLQKTYVQAIKKLQSSSSQPKNKIKFDTLAQEVQQLQRTQTQALQYELKMIRDLKKAEKQYKIQKIKKQLIDQNKQNLQQLQRQTQYLITKLKRLKQQQYINKITQAQKRIKQNYLNSIKEIRLKFDQQQQIVQIQGNIGKRDQSAQIQSVELIDHMLESLARKQEYVRKQICAVQEEIGKVSKNTKPVKHRLSDDQLRVYELIRQKLEQACSGSNNS